MGQIIVSQPRFPYNRQGFAEPVPGAPALEAINVRAGYPDNNSAALRGVSLRVPVGTKVALVGPNGAGKSTLLKAAAGLLPLEGGELRLSGWPVGVCRQRVAYLPQRSEIDWRFPINVHQLVLTGRYIHLGWLKRPNAHDNHLVERVLARLGLNHLAERQIDQLSGGQQQRALLARALVQEADLLLLDEPLNAVDTETRTVITEVLAELQQQGKTVLVATHDLGRLETDFDGALYLNEGREVPAPPGAFVGLRVGQEAAWEAG
ncbi:MAG: ABC transporter ATP-binding protein [Anaerolineales bacterium]|nr:ABC transporter ATP-binding protein [Anaerolineales bacterium]